MNFCSLTLAFKIQEHGLQCLLTTLYWTTIFLEFPFQTQKICPKKSSWHGVYVLFSMRSISSKIQGSTAELALNIPYPQHIRTLPSKHSSRNSNGDFINEDWKQKMLQASDEILKFLNKDYNFCAHKRAVHN
jgi:hypothetical protein